MNESIDILVERPSLRRIALRPASEPSLRDGQLLLSVDQFAWTSNNLTYARQPGGEFWTLFPAEEPWGRIPVWGFADVVASRVPAIAPGERVFGFLPMSTHLRVEPVRISERGFFDAAAHRAGVFPLYNAYARVKRMPARREDVEAVLRPLFATSFVLEDFLRSHAFFGAGTVLVSSASSKTALGTAFRLREGGGPFVCGLTAEPHRAFVRGTGCFDAVHAYAALASLDLPGRVLFVDFAGDEALSRAVQERLGSRRVRTLRVGATHAVSKDAPLLDFFGPARMRELRRAWGADAFRERLEAAAVRFESVAARWLQVERCDGMAPFQRAYACVLEGRLEPSRAFVVRLADAQAASAAEEHAVQSLLGLGATCS